MDTKIKYYENKLKQMLSNDDFHTYIKDPDLQDKIITYKELKNFNTISDLLPNNFDYKILLIETKRNEGHWTVLVRKDDNIFWCDSYGMQPDEELKMIPMFIRMMLGQENDEVKRLLKTATQEGFTVNKNQFDFQADKPNINTCGRWVLFFIECIKEGMDFNQMMNLVEKRETITGKPSDVLVVDWFP